MSANGKYSDEEVRKILDRALRGEPDRSVSHDELVAIASEVGVSREAIDTAARQLQLEGELEQARKRVLRRRRRRLVSHASSFAIVNAFLFLINYLTSPGQWWFLFPVFGWGFGLIFHAWFALSGEVSARALRKEQRRATKEAAHAIESKGLVPPERVRRAESSSRSSTAPGPTQRARIDAASAASDSDTELEPEPETAELTRRRE